MCTKFCRQFISTYHCKTTTSALVSYTLCPLCGGISNHAVWRLSVAQIGPKSRIERTGKTKIGTEVAHVTRDSYITFKVKRSKVTEGGAYCLLHSLFSSWCGRRNLEDFHSFKTLQNLRGKLITFLAISEKKLAMILLNKVHDQLIS